MHVIFKFDINRSANRIKPTRLVLFGVLFFVGMWVIAPVEPAKTLTKDSVGYIIACIIACLLGCNTLKGKKLINNYSYDIKNVKNIYNITLFLSLIAIILRLFDIFVARGQGVGLESFEKNIDAGLQQESSILSIVVAVMYFIPFLPVFLNFCFPFISSKRSKIVAFILFCFIGIGAFISGSRNAFLDPLLLLAFLYIFTRDKIKFKLKGVLIISTLVFAFLMISSVLFIQRLNVQNRTIFDSTESLTGGYSDKVPPKDYYVELMSENQNNPAILGFLFAYVQTTQYAIHGFWEFPLVKDNIDNHKYRTYGSSTFVVIDKFLYKFGIGFDPELTLLYNARPGIWSTFFFNWYLDFGYWGIFMMFLLGMLVKYVWNKIRYEKNIFYLPLLLFFMLVFMYIMQLNRFVGTGTYAMVCFTVFALWSTKKCRIKKIVNV